jgi:hypothetical protein
MKVLSGLLLAPTLAAVLLLDCAPTNAARRGGGSAFDGSWSVAIYTQRGDCGSRACSSTDRRRSRLF